MRSRSAVILSFSLFLGCSRQAPESSPDAGVGASPLTAIHAHGAFASRLANATLRRIDDGYAIEAGPRGALRTTFPLTTSDPIRVSSLTIQPLDLARSAAVVEGPTLVYRDAAHSTDLVLAPSHGGFEELRVLRDASAPTTFRWRISGHVRKTPYGIEVTDDKGLVLAAAEHPWAIDANGTRRDLTTSIEGDLLVASLAIEDLAFPVVVDPTWSSVPNLRTVRYAPVLIALNDGKVVSIPNDTAPWTDLYDPATNSWSSMPDITLTTWTGANAVLLADGNVLVTSGADTAAVRFNYPAMTWTTYGVSQPSKCDNCKLVRLSDGRVLKAQTTSGGTFVNVEIFNPATYESYSI